MIINQFLDAPRSLTLERLRSILATSELEDGVEKKPAPKSPEEAGGRNNYFASRAGKMRRDGFDADAILAAIRSENASKGYALPDRELVTIARSISSYEIGDKDPTIIDTNVKRGFVNHGVRVDAVGRLRSLHDDTLVRNMSPGFLSDLIWNDLRKLGRVSPEDISRIIGIEIHYAAEAERQKIAGRILGKPESPEALEELRRFVVAISGKADSAIIGGFLQFMWCVKRSLAGLAREHDIMPILYNPIQGNGKSTAVRRMVSPMAELVDSITAETLADERKRADLGRFVIGVWDEMEGADKRDTDAIKNALSSQEVSYRPMRTNDNVSIVRSMNFIGTSNKPLAAMVRDSSGNRRFVEVETLTRLDHAAINGINYPLLWQAISEKAAAPIKAILGEVRVHQAEGRYQDSVQLWLESYPPTPGQWLSTEEWRNRYTAWCERCGDSPISFSLFSSRLKGEGFKRFQQRVGKERQWGYSAPTPPSLSPVEPEVVTSGDKVVTTKTLMDTIDMSLSPLSPPKSDVEREKQKFPLMPFGVVTGGDMVTTPWPTPPAPGRELWVYDLEVFPNRFMFSAFNGSTWVEFDESSIAEMAEFVRNKSIVLAGFNNHGYDDIIVGTLAGRDYRMRYPQRIYELSCRLIDPKTEADRDANFKARYLGRPWAYSIDVFQLLNGKGALKEWECRIGFPTVAESPAPFDKPLPDKLVASVRQYCRNDVLATAELLRSRFDLVRLRETLNEEFDLGARAYCLSEQGLAQATFLNLHRLRTGERSNAVRAKAAEAPENTPDRFPMTEIVSERVQFVTEPFQKLHATLLAGSLFKKKSWEIELGDAGLSESYDLADCKIALGVGGLHTVDAPGIFTADADTALVDLDVTSYYPSLMLGERVFPSQLGEDFLTDLADLRAKRVAAKKAGDKVTADALKIVLNATFGKLNDSWSPIRSVRNAFRVTINGQLYLLMLIEALHSKGFEILSANTDGVLIRASRAKIDSDLEATIAPWQEASGLALERTNFARICRRDVNTYVAIDESGKIKTKGAMNPESGKGDGQVIRNAVVAYLLHGIDPAKTVAEETNPISFLFYQRVKNGGELVCGTAFLGKTVRWFVTKDGMPLRRKNPDGSFDTIPNGHHIGLALDITGLPTADAMSGLDRNFYVEAAWDLIRSVGPA